MVAHAKQNNIVPFPAQAKRNRPQKGERLFGALDLGTNSCRMLIARPKETNFEVVDAFSKTVYLGRGLEKTGKLDRAAIDRTISALSVCARKLSKHQVKDKRLVATASCRLASNGKDFVRRVKQETGLRLEIIKPEEEARLAVIGCAAHLQKDKEQLLVVDIGGGSTELIWLDMADVLPEMRRQAIMGLRSNLKKPKQDTPVAGVKVVDWISVPFGVTTLNEQFSDVAGDADRYAMMSWYFEEYIAQFGPQINLNAGESLKDFQIIGASGTVTTIASTYLRLPRYNRDEVDGVSMTAIEVESEIDRYLKLGPSGRAVEPCIGANRKEFIMSGAAILQAILRVWPTDTLTIADRGLREGLLYSQMAKQGILV